MTDYFDEIAMLKRIADDDREAFKTIYLHYLDDIYKYIYVLVKSKESSKDIVQKVFIKVWDRRRFIKDIDSFRAYLYRCAKNLVIDDLRRKKVGEKVYEILTPSSIESSDKTDAKLICKEYLEIAKKAMDDLPWRRKQIVELYTMHEYSFDEIAHVLSLSKSVVKKQVYAGILFLRTYLKKYADLDI